MSREKIKVIFDWYKTLSEVRFYQHAPTNFVPLVVGPSGSGKTYTIQSQIERIEAETGYLIPFIHIDATTFTGTGWHGPELSDLIQDQLDEIIAKNCLSHTYADLLESEFGAVIFIDEIDKILISGGDRDHNFQSQRQYELLKLFNKDAKLLFNGSDVDRRRGKTPIFAGLDNVLFIFGGAFEPIFKHKWATSTKNIGFTSAVKSYSIEELYKQRLTWQDFEDFGAVPELLNRMTNLIQLDPYSDDEIRQIFTESYDVKLASVFLNGPCDVQKTIQEVKKSKSGARIIPRVAYEGALERAAKTRPTDSGRPKRT